MRLSKAQKTRKFEDDGLQNDNDRSLSPLRYRCNLEKRQLIINQPDSEQVQYRKQSSLIGEVPSNKVLTRKLYSKESLQSPLQEGSGDEGRPAAEVEIKPILKQKSDRIVTNAYQ